MIKKVLFICGSLQKRSSNKAALNIAQNRFERSEIAIKNFDKIADIPAFNPENHTQEESPVAELRSEISDSDAVVIASPEYAAALPGALKNALDWMVGSGELYSKPVALISAGTTGGVHVRNQLIQSLTWQGAHVIGHLGIVSPKTKTNSNGEIIDPFSIDSINTLVDQIIGIEKISDEELTKLVEKITTQSGIEPGHIAPVRSPLKNIHNPTT